MAENLHLSPTYEKKYTQVRLAARGESPIRPRCRQLRCLFSRWRRMRTRQRWMARRRRILPRLQIRLCRGRRHPPRRRRPPAPRSTWRVGGRVADPKLALPSGRTYLPPSPIPASTLAAGHPRHRAVREHPAHRQLPHGRLRHRAKRRSSADSTITVGDTRVLVAAPFSSVNITVEWTYCYHSWFVTISDSGSVSMHVQLTGFVCCIISVLMHISKIWLSFILAESLISQATTLRVSYLNLQSRENKKTLCYFAWLWMLVLKH